MLVQNREEIIDVKIEERQVPVASRAQFLDFNEDKSDNFDQVLVQRKKPQQVENPFPARFKKKVEGSSTRNEKKIDRNFGPFGQNPPEMSEASLKLQNWIQKMSDFNDKTPHSEESALSSDPREYLFPCSRDEFAVSDNLKVKKMVRFSANGLADGWIIFYPGRIILAYGALGVLIE